MPTYIDGHDIRGVTAEDVAKAHEADLEKQGKVRSEMSPGFLASRLINNRSLLSPSPRNGREPRCVARCGRSSGRASIHNRCGRRNNRVRACNRAGRRSLW
jgi:hypothetical protein